MTENRTTWLQGEALASVDAYVPAKNLRVTQVQGELLISLFVIPESHISQVTLELLVSTSNVVLTPHKAAAQIFG